MQTSVPQTSTKLIEALSTEDLATVMAKKKHTSKPELSIEVHGGTMWWTVLDAVAVVDECRSILDGDIESFELNNVNVIEDIIIIAGAGVTFNLEIK